MVVKQVFDHSLRAHGRRFISSLMASNRYSVGYLANLETSVAMVALYIEEQGWPEMQEIATEQPEDYFAYLPDRTRRFGEWTYAEHRKLSTGHINARSRRLNRFFNWLVARGPNDESPMPSTSAPKQGENTVPTITEDQVRDLLTLADPFLAMTPAHRLRLVRGRALLYTYWDTPSRLAEIAKLRLDDVVLTNGMLLVMGKGPKERRMPNGDAARPVMWDYQRERETLMPWTKVLWVSEQWEAVLPSGIYQILKRLAKRANIEDMHPHGFRRSYAINALRAGRREWVLQIFGGERGYPTPTSARWGPRTPRTSTVRRVRPTGWLGRAPSARRTR